MNKKGETAPDHARLHNKDNPKKPEHGVFREDAVKATDAAYKKAVREGLSLETVPQGQNLNVRVPNVGSTGGKTAAAAGTTGQPLNTVTIGLEKGVSSGGKAKVITAFPSARKPQGSTLPYVSTPAAGAAVGAHAREHQRREQQQSGN